VRFDLQTPLEMAERAKKKLAEQRLSGIKDSTP
jgi:hypothetical protein